MMMDRKWFSFICVLINIEALATAGPDADILIDIISKREGKKIWHGVGKRGRWRECWEVPE